MIGNIEKLEKKEYSETIIWKNYFKKEQGKFTGNNGGIDGGGMKAKEMECVFFVKFQCKT